MKKFLKIIGYLLLVVIILISGVLIFVKAALPNVGPAPDLKVVSTPEKIERGRYLANSVTVCMDCHSTRDWSRFAAPLLPGTLGKGGERFDHDAGFPGIYYSKNITPSGITRYTDGELFRLITTGVTKEGRAMFPVMPYGNYGKLDPADIEAIIAYIRSLPAIENTPPDSKSDFPMNFIINTIPAKATPGKLPSKDDKVAYGGYLVTAASCIECHTAVDKGKIIQSLAYSGGREFNLPNGTVRSANITPDKETGIGLWTKENFVKRFTAFADSAYQIPIVKSNEFNTIMPWNMYGHMTTEDLEAIYTYLATLKPISNKVLKFSPAQTGK